MNTKWGITSLIVGGYLLALGIAGINANSGGARVVFSVVLVAGFVLAGWSVVLPWDADPARRESEIPGAVPRS